MDSRDSSVVSRRLREARLMRGLTQEMLGIKAGLDEFTSSTRMNQYERGRHTPGYSLLERCASVLNVPVEFFYSKGDDVADLLLGYHQLSAESKTKIVELIHQLQHHE